MEITKLHEAVAHYLEEPTLTSGQVQAASLHLLADFFETRPTCASNFNGPYVTIWPYGKEDWKACLKELGTFKKDSTNYGLDAVKDIGGIKVKVTMAHETACEKVQNGTHTVTKEVYPEGVEPTLVEVQEPTYEWMCPPKWKD